MASENLQKLASAGKLKAEPPSAKEFAALVGSGRARLGDARNAKVSLEGRFDLAYNAAHALSLASTAASSRSTRSWRPSSSR